LLSQTKPDPTLFLAPFGSVLGLAAQQCWVMLSSQTQQLLTEKASPPTVIFDKKKNTAKERPQGATVLFTMKAVYAYSVVHNAMCLCQLPHVLKEPTGPTMQRVYAYSRTQHY
jgi:hypothetical protein